MIQSHIIDVNGTFVGAAVRLSAGYRFVAVDGRMESLNDTVWPNLMTVQKLARQLFIAGRFVQPEPHAVPSQPWPSPSSERTRCRPSHPPEDGREQHR